MPYKNMDTSLLHTQLAPEWNDPATKYIKKSIVDNVCNQTGTIPNLKAGMNEGSGPKNHFLYPL